MKAILFFAALVVAGAVFVGIKTKQQEVAEVLGTKDEIYKHLRASTDARHSYQAPMRVGSTKDGEGIYRIKFERH